MPDPVVTPAQEPVATPDTAPVVDPISDEAGDTGLDVEKVMNFDPFEEGTFDDDPASGGTGDSPSADVNPATEQEVASQGDPAPGVDPAPTAEVVPAVGEVELDEMAVLRQQVLQQQQTIDQFKVGPAPVDPAATTQAQPGQGTDVPAEIQVPEYNYDIPTELMARLESENPQEKMQGYQQLIQGVSQTVHKNLMTEMQNQSKTMLEQHIPQFVQGSIKANAQGQAIFQDFYGTFKELNRPEIYPIVKQTAGQVMQDLGVQQWSPQVRDEVGKRVRATLGVVTPAQVQTLAPADAPNAIIDQGSSPRHEAGSQDLADEVASLLF